MAIEMTSASRALRVGTVALTAIACRGGCIGPPIWSTALRVGVVERHTFVIRAPGSATITTTQTPLVIFTHPAAQNTAPVSFRDLGPARCDSVAVRGTSGCVRLRKAVDSYEGAPLPGTAGAGGLRVRIDLPDGRSADSAADWRSAVARGAPPALMLADWAMTRYPDGSRQVAEREFWCWPRPPAAPFTLTLE